MSNDAHRVPKADPKKEHRLLQLEFLPGSNRESVVARCLCGVDLESFVTGTTPNIGTRARNAFYKHVGKAKTWDEVGAQR